MRLFRLPFQALTIGLMLTGSAASTAAAQQRAVVRPLSAGSTGMSLAEALLRDGRRKDAADVLGRWIAENPNDGRAYQYLGGIYLSDAMRWHREGHLEGDHAGASLFLEFAAEAFRQAQQLMVDSASLSLVTVAIELATIRVEEAGWDAAMRSAVRVEEVPLPPVLVELADNLLGSCPAGGVLVTTSPVERAAVWGRALVNGNERGQILVRPELYDMDGRYRVRMAEALGVPIELDLHQALAHLAIRKPVCLSPATDSPPGASFDWQPVGMVMASGPGSREVDVQLSVHQLGMTGLAGSPWSAAVRDIYDLAARRNRSICGTTLSQDRDPRLPAVPACNRQ